jgi:predicted membrane-bound spermidine synthase
MFFSIFLISAAVLAYEIILMRIFSITQWHHFAYMIISIALLGFGASGTFISFFRSRLQKRFLLSYRLFSLLFPLSMIASYFLSQQNKFNPFEIVWNPRQYFHLLEYYLVLFIPFFLAATCIGLMFTQYTDKIGLIYCYNLVGSGIGAVGAMACLYFVHPVQFLYGIVGIALCGTAATFLHSHREGHKDIRSKERHSRIFFSFTVSIYAFIIFIAFLAVKYDPLDFRDHLNISQYKGLTQAKKFPEANVRAELVSPLGVVHAVSSPIIRNAPGLSLNYKGEVPSQIGLFIDSGNAGAITRAEDIDYLDFLSSSLVYHIRPISDVLILGAGGGTDVLNALYHQAAKVDAVELDSNIIWLVQEQFRDFSSDLYSRPNIQIINHEARGYIETTHSTYDSIQISLLDSFGASSAGVHALHENYLYTIEALKRYYSRLTSQGILSITRWVKFPPRDNIKLFATAVEALEELEITDVSQHLVSVRSWATCTLLVSKTPFTDEEIEHVRMFCHERAFDANYFPGIALEDVNIYNQIPAAEYYRAAQELLGGNRNAFYNSYPYFVRPARDDSPYFFHFFKWKSLPALLKTMGKEWIPFIEWGYLVLLATLIQAGVVSIVLIITPLFALLQQPTLFRYKLYTFIYFTCLGLGYLFVEIVFIQKFTLFLANPFYAASVIISSFLISSGFGSLYFERREAKGERRTTRNLQLFLAVGGLIGLSLGYILFLPVVFSYCSGWGNLSKVLMTVVLIVPLGFCMGIPFPLGMNRLHGWTSQLVPWAYGINGCASVLSSLIATCIAIPWGFRTVILLAGILYSIAAGTLHMNSKGLLRN